MEIARASARPAPSTPGPRTGASTPPGQRIRAIFYGLVAGLFVALDGSLAVFVIAWSRPTSVALFAVLSLLFFGVAYGLAREIVALTCRFRPLPALREAPSGRRVAILYTTMNDVVAECLSSIRQDYPVDVFVLDDSSDPGARAIVDSIAAPRRFTVVRRAQRTGFKAGAVNAWLTRWGDRYDYLVLLDSDSYLPPDWVRLALRYSEHPKNDRVAILQGTINIWNLDTRFVDTLAPFSRVSQLVWEAHLANALDAVFCYGHNAMVRVAALRDTHGFVEGFVSEDFATAVALADQGWHSRFVPLHTYEAMPENLRGFIKRQRKWTRGAMEFPGFCRRSKLGPGQKLHLWKIPFDHLTTLLLPIGMFLTVYGYASTPSIAAAFLTRLVHSPIATIWSQPIFRFLIVVGALTAVPRTWVLARAKIDVRTWWSHRWLSSAISGIMIPYEIASMVRYAVQGIGTIPVTPKSEAPLSYREILYLSRFTLLMAAGLLVGVAIVNPVAGVFNATWLVPLLLSPLVVYRFSRPAAMNPEFAPFVSETEWMSALRLQQFQAHSLLIRARSPIPAGLPRPMAAIG